MISIFISIVLNAKRKQRKVKGYANIYGMESFIACFRQEEGVFYELCFCGKVVIIIFIGL